MADPALVPAGPSQAGNAPSVAELDTVAGSLIHSSFALPDTTGSEGGFTLLKVYLAAVALTFLPLFVAAALSPLPLVASAGSPRLPFFHDWSVWFMFLFSFPCLMILSVTDQHVLAQALRSVRADGTITIAAEEEPRLVAAWRRRFRIINLVGQVLGVIVGGAVAYFNFRAYTPASVGYWIARDGQLLPVGFVFLYCVFLFYFIGTAYIFRSIAISLLLKDIVERAELHMLPLHPDKCGGLRPVGELGLRNQYALTLFGLNIVLLVAVSRLHLDVPDTVNSLILAAIVGYLVLGPIVFVAPLLPFRGAMLKSRGKLMGEVAQRMRVELDRVRGELPSGRVSEEDHQLIERLRKIGAVIEELPVWPFDAGTLRRFLTAYVVPIISGVTVPIAKMLAGFLKVQLPV